MEPLHMMFKFAQNAGALGFLIDVLAVPRCTGIQSPSASGVVAAAREAKEEEEEEGKKGVLKKWVCGRPVWRRILFASKKTRSIIILNALTVIYGTHISFGLIPASLCMLISIFRLMWRPCTGEAAHKDPAQGHRGRS
jgi:hypothetical protein